MGETLAEKQLLDRVLNEWAQGENERFNQLVGCFLTHLHQFAWETQLRRDEWLEILKFLEDTGKLCTNTRNEYQLLSDVIGLTSAVNLINEPEAGHHTESAVIGPFYVEESPVVENGGSIIRQHCPGGEKTLVQGKVLSQSGEPICNALLDIWQTSPNTLYAVQDPQQDPDNLRAKIHTGADGCYSFVTYKPCAYPIPRDGTVGKILQLGARHGMRPAHIHFIVSAEGYESVATQLFTSDDPYLWSDAVFAEKDSLVVTYDEITEEQECRWQLNFDFELRDA